MRINTIYLNIGAHHKEQLKFVAGNLIICNGLGRRDYGSLNFSAESLLILGLDNGNNGTFSVLGLPIADPERHPTSPQVSSRSAQSASAASVLLPDGGREGVSPAANEAQKQGSERTHLMLTFRTSLR